MPRIQKPGVDLDKLPVQQHIHYDVDNDNFRLEKVFITGAARSVYLESTTESMTQLISFALGVMKELATQDNK